MIERKKLLRNLLGKLIGNKKHVPIMLLSIIKLRERGEDITVEKVKNEAKKIIRNSNEVFRWGINEEDITIQLTSDILEELVSIGVLEPVGDVGNKLERKYKLASKTSGLEEDIVESEVLRSLGLILARRCC